MEILDELIFLIEKLKTAQSAKYQSIDKIQCLINLIEYHLLPPIEEKFHEYQNLTYKTKKPHEIDQSIITQIENMLDEADALIYFIRQKYDLDNEVHETDDEEDENNWPISNDVNFFEDCYDSNDYIIVLNEISKSVMKTIGIKDDNPIFVNLIAKIILDIRNKDDDDIIANKALVELTMTGFYMEKDDIKEMCKRIRETCQMHLIALDIAIEDIRDYHCSAELALSQIQKLIL